jgi:hypothetical protein
MSVRAWWIALSAIGALNIGAWVLAAVVPVRRGRADPAYRVRWRQVWLSGPFVFGCAFRSFFPRADVQRIVVVDSWLSSVAIGRTVAMIAELSFAAQCALFLRHAGDAGRSSVAVAISRAIVPLIVMAETFSWYSVATTNYIGNTFEESTWTLSAALLIAGMALSRRGATGGLRAFLGQAIWITCAYLVFLMAIDVPMYFGRWRADTAAGRAYLSISEGVRDAATRWIVTTRWEDWNWEMLWMSLYFSFGVWISVALVRAPYPAAYSLTTTGNSADRR